MKFKYEYSLPPSPKDRGLCGNSRYNTSGIEVELCIREKMKLKLGASFSFRKKANTSPKTQSGKHMALLVIVFFYWSYVSKQWHPATLIPTFTVITQKAI